MQKSRLRHRFLKDLELWRLRLRYKFLKGLGLQRLRLRYKLLKGLGLWRLKLRHRFNRLRVQKSILKYRLERLSGYKDRG